MGIVVVKNWATIYQRIDSRIESAGLVSVWARGINHGVLRQAFLDLLTRQADQTG